MAASFERVGESMVVLTSLVEMATSLTGWANVSIIYM